MEIQKQTVTFSEFIGWRDHPAGAVQAQLVGVKGHSKLGNQSWVRTSAVNRIEYAEGTYEPVLIETLNTIYVKEMN